VVPEPVAPSAVPSIRRRLAALVYEALLVMGVLAVAFLVPQMVLGMAAHILLPGWFLFLYLVLVLGAYFLWHWRRGQTLAMRTWKLRLRAADGSAPSLQRLALRYALAWPSVLFFGVGILWALADRDRQFLHDRLAGTRIVFA
jgi:uncharacterized RDD family membrane protein YckC